MRRVRRGDTLVEVMFAVGIFGLVAIGAIALMNQGLYTGQTTLETTMARQEIDAQIEALRFIHNAYTSESKRDDSVYRPIWRALTNNAYEATAESNGILLEDNDFYTRTVENDKTCEEVFASGYPDKAFVINPRKLDTDVVDTDTVVYRDNSGSAEIRTASIYPRLLYGATTGIADENLSDATATESSMTVKTNSTLLAAEGIWVTAVVSQDGVKDESGSRRPDFYDFYVHTCWDKVGGKGSTSINSILRLYNPDQISYDGRAKYQGYELIYDANGGTGAPETQRYDDVTYPSHLFQISDTKPTRAGYRFLGWAKSKDATSPAYYPGGSITVHALKTVLYAVWEAPWSFALTYSANGGYLPSGFAATDSYGPTYDERHDFRVKSGTPTRNGYEFLGWYDSASGSTKYNAGATISLSRSAATKTIYARWRQLYTHTLNYDANGGSGAPASQSYTDASTTCNFTVASGTPTRSGYVFLGWSESKTATSATYTAGNTISVGTTKTLYAVWKYNIFSFTLAYNANGGSGAPSNETKSGSWTTASFTVKSGTPTRSGYTFLGWSESSGATSATYHAGNTVTVNRNSTKTLYAVWQRVYSFKLVYNANGGSGAPSNETKTGTGASMTFTVKSGTPTRSGYVFLGWGLSSDSSATLWAGNAVSVSRDSTKTLYAVWAATMQNWNGCGSLAKSATIRLVDTRDGKYYTARKFADGKCWMIQDLQFNFATHGDKITESNTTIKDATFRSQANAKPAMYTYVESDSTSVKWNKVWSWIRHSKIINYLIQDGNYYYNIYAGTNLCPAGWRVPTSKPYGSSDFETLQKTYDAYLSPYRGYATLQSLADFKKNGVVWVNHENFQHSSAVRVSTSFGYYLSQDYGYLNVYDSAFVTRTLSGSDDHTGGFSLRCVTN